MCIIQLQNDINLGASTDILFCSIALTTNLNRNDLNGVHFCFFCIFTFSAALCTLSDIHENRKIKNHLFCLNVIHRNRMHWCCCLFYTDTWSDGAPSTSWEHYVNIDEDNKCKKKRKRQHRTHTHPQHFLIWICGEYQCRNGSARTHAYFSPISLQTCALLLLLYCIRKCLHSK